MHIDALLVWATAGRSVMAYVRLTFPPPYHRPRSHSVYGSRPTWRGTKIFRARGRCRKRRSCYDREPISRTQAHVLGIPVSSSPLPNTALSHSLHLPFQLCLVCTYERDERGEQGKGRRESLSTRSHTRGNHTITIHGVNNILLNGYGSGQVSE